MSRVFKPKPKMQWTESKEELAVGRGKEKPGGKRSSGDVGVTGGGKPRAVSCSQSQMQSRVHSQPARSQRKATGGSVSTSLRAEAWSVQGGRSCAMTRL